MGSFSQVEFTNIIEKIPVLLTDHFKHSWPNRAQNLAYPVQVLDELILACNDNLNELHTSPWVGLDTLERKAVNTLGRALVLEPPLDLDDKKTLLAAIKIHLEAIRDGYRLGLMNTDQFGSAPQAGQYTLPSESRRPVEITHVHYVYGRSTFWEDLFFWNMLTHYSCDRHYHRPYVEPWYPTIPTGGQQKAGKNSDGNDEASATFYFVLGAIALAAACYGSVHTLRTLDEVANGEHLKSNLAKLGLVTVATGAGAVAGLALAAAAVANPAFCVVAGAIILASLSYLPLNALQQSGLESQMRGDSRFELTQAEQDNLIKKNPCLNPKKVEEAIRALAIEMKNTTAYAMNFWSDGNKRRSQIIDTLRQLKRGEIKTGTILIGQQAFKLVNEYSTHAPAPSAPSFDEIPFATDVKRIDESMQSSVVANGSVPEATLVDTNVHVAETYTPSAPPLHKM